MSSERDRDDPILERRLGRGDLLKFGALAAGSGLLAACGAEGAADPATTEEAGATTEAVERPPRRLHLRKLGNSYSSWTRSG